MASEILFDQILVVQLILNQFWPIGLNVCEKHPCRLFSPYPKLGRGWGWGEDMGSKQYRQLDRKRS